MRLAVVLRRKGLTGILAAAAVMASGCAKSPEARSAEYMSAGRKLMEKHEITRAILQFRNAAQATPKNAEAYYQLALAYLSAGDLRSGLLSLRKTLELNPKHAAAQVRLGQIASNAHDPAILKDSEKRLQTLLQEGGDNADALHTLALTELKLGKPEDAMGHLTRAMAMAPQESAVAVTLARAKLQQQDIKGAEQVLKQMVESDPKSTENALILGEFYRSQNRASEAEQQYRRALELNPDNPSALFDMATLTAALGRNPEAEQNLKKLSVGSDKRFRHFYASFLFQQNRSDEAVREFERLAKADPEDRAARTRLVSVYSAVNRPADAAKVIEQALKKNPKDMDALVQRAEMALAAGKFSAAEADLNQVLVLNPAAAEPRYIMAKLRLARGEPLRYREDLFKALELDRYLLAVRLELAQSLIDSNDGKGALDVLDKAPEFQKQLTAAVIQRNWALWATGDMAAMRKGIDAGLSQERTEDLLLQDGLWKLRAGDAIGARAAVEEALKINPEDVRALSALRSSYTVKESAQALQKMKEYASRQPKSAAVQGFVGTLLMINGDRKEARAAYEAAKAADPKSVRASLSLIQVDLADEKMDDAKHKLEALLASDRDNTLARVWLGNVEAMKGNSQAAIEQFRKVVVADPNNVQALNNLAYLLAQASDQSSEALKYAQRANELAPDSPEYQDTLGWILYRSGAYPSAVTQLERAASRGDDAVLKYHLAMAYAKLGDLRRGRTVLQAALKQNPNLPEAKSALQMLKTAK